MEHAAAEPAETLEGESSAQVAGGVGVCGGCGHVEGSDDRAHNGESGLCVPCHLEALRKVVAEGKKKAKKKPGVRAGTMTKGKDGKGPAKPAGDGKTVRPEFDPGYVVEKLDLWRVNEKGGGFMMRSTVDGEWMPLTRSELESELECMGLPKGDKSQPVREVERVIHYVQNRRKVDMVMNLAGYWPGVVKLGTLRVLVRKGPELLVPKEGEFPVLRKVMEGMFRVPLEGPEMPHFFQIYVKSEPIAPEQRLAVWRSLVWQDEVADEDRGEMVPRYWLDQTVLVFSWLRLMLEVLYRRQAGEDVMRNGHALMIAGKADGGKSFIMGLLEKMLGGRRANVEQYLTGKTPFNSDGSAAEMGSMSDAPLGTKMDERDKLGEFIKEYVAEGKHRIHPKSKDASYMLPLLRRLVWAFNDDPKNLRQVPQMVPELRDKVLWVRANALAMPMETKELDDYMAFGRKIDEELPCFVWWLMNAFQVPEVLKGGRFGMLGVQDPWLIQEMQEDSDGGQFLELLDAARWEVVGAALNFWDYVATRTVEAEHFLSEDKQVWTGSAVRLKEMLTGEECSVAEEFRGMLKSKRIDRLLGRLKKDEPGRVEFYRKKTGRFWKVSRPPQ